MSSISRPLGLTLLVSGLFVSHLPDSIAQAPGNRRGEFVQELVKTLIDSRAPTPISNAPTEIARTAPAKMRQASELLNQATTEMSQLVMALQADIYRAPVRNLLMQAMNLNATASLLVRKLAATSDVEPLRPELRQLDQDWRLLEHRLAQTEGLSANTKAQIQKVKAFEEQLTSLFGVPPQIDLAEIEAHTSQLRTAVRNLYDDIQQEVTDPALANQFMVDARNLIPPLKEFARTIHDNESSQVAQRAFQQFDVAWANLSRKLRPINNRYIAKQSQRIDESLRHLKDLLWINDPGLSREELRYVAQLIERDTAELLDRVTLRMLARLPDAGKRAVIEAASQFDGSSREFISLLRNGDSDFALQNLFPYVVDDWQQFRSSMLRIDSAAAREALSDIDRSFAQLQESLGIEPELDRTRIADTASHLAASARGMEEEIRGYFARPNRYPREFQDESLRSIVAFQTAVRNLQNRIIRNEPAEKLAEEVQIVANNWQSFTRYVSRFTVTEQQRLLQSQREISPQVVQLQTLLAL